MVVTNRSIKTVILPAIARRAEEAEAKQKERRKVDIDEYYRQERDPEDGSPTLY